MSNYKYGDCGNKLAAVWRQMLNRCYNKNSNKNKAYYYRGIRVCKEWKAYENFKLWALQNGYCEGLQLDRIDNNGNYTPENCRWATRSQQQRNKRNTIKVTIEGETKTLADWAEIFCVPYNILYQRARKAGLIKRRRQHAKNT